jgi:hypothetical protein
VAGSDGDVSAFAVQQLPGQICHRAGDGRRSQAQAHRGFADVDVIDGEPADPGCRCGLCSQTGQPAVPSRAITREAIQEQADMALSTITELKE